MNLATTFSLDLESQCMDPGVGPGGEGRVGEALPHPVAAPQGQSGIQGVSWGLQTYSGHCWWTRGVQTFRFDD